MNHKDFIPLDPDVIPEEELDVVAVGAHADDVDVNCGGSLAKFAKAGFKVGIIDLTNAEPTPLNDKYRSPDDYDDDYADVRKAEAMSSAKELGVKVRYIMDLPNRELFDSFEARCKLATVFRKWKPKVILGMYNGDPFQGPDHDAARLITDGAIFNSKLTKWEKYMGNLPAWRIPVPPVYHYLPLTVPHHPIDKHGQMTTFFIDISKEIEQKKNALRCYKSQFGGKDASDFLTTINGIQGFFLSRSVNKLYLEHFLTHSPIILTTDNFKSIFLP